MFVYGIRCDVQELIGIPADVIAEYYMDYKLLVFPEYTRATMLNSHGNLGTYFWEKVARIVSRPQEVHQVDMEHPYISTSEAAVIESLEARTPERPGSDWYYVPRVANPPTEVADPPSLSVPVFEVEMMSE